MWILYSLIKYSFIHSYVDQRMVAGTEISRTIIQGHAQH